MKNKQVISNDYFEITFKPEKAQITGFGANEPKANLDRKTAFYTVWTQGTSKE